MITIVTEGRGLSVQSIILLISAGRVMNVLIPDWLVENGYYGSEDEEESPSTHFTTSANNPSAYQSPAMSCSNLCDAAPFQFLLGRVAGETISPWDRRKFPCAWANGMVAYPMDTEVRRSILPFVGSR